jgi:hypothetical protein
VWVSSQHLKGLPFIDGSDGCASLIDTRIPRIGDKAGQATDHPDRIFIFVLSLRPPPTRIADSLRSDDMELFGKLIIPSLSLILVIRSAVSSFCGGLFPIGSGSLTFAFAVDSTNPRVFEEEGNYAIINADTVFPRNRG